MTVGPFKVASPGAFFFASLLTSRRSIRSLQDRAALHPISPVIERLHLQNVWRVGCYRSLFVHLGR